MGGIPAKTHKEEKLLIFLGIIDILQSYRYESQGPTCLTVGQVFDKWTQTETDLMKVTSCKREGGGISRTEETFETPWFITPFSPSDS